MKFDAQTKNVSSKDKKPEEQKSSSSKDGGVSKAGRKRTKKVFDDEWDGSSVENLIKDGKQKATKRKNVSDGGMSRVGRKRKKKVLDGAVYEDDGQETEEVHEEIDSEDSYVPPTSTKKSEKKVKKQLQSKTSVDAETLAKVKTEGDVSTEGFSNATLGQGDTEDAPAIKPEKIRKPRTRDKNCKVKQDSALAYLKKWYKQRRDWHFKKLHQIWLLENMYKDDKVTDRVFGILLKYLENLKGGAKDRTTKDAVAIIENTDMEESDDKKSTRAREILYAIQDS